MSPRSSAFLLPCGLAGFRGRGAFLDRLWHFLGWSSTMSDSDVSKTEYQVLCYLILKSRNFLNPGIWEKLIFSEFTYLIDG